MYMSLTLFLQYLLYVLNITASTCPAPFPPGYEGYPKNEDPKDLTIKHAVPVFFHYKFFRWLEINYLLGIGVDKDQIWCMFFDFMNLFAVTMYIWRFMNPVLTREMKKVFWQFPSPDEIDQWARLDKAT